MTFWCPHSLPLPRSEQCKWSEVRRTWVFLGCLKGEVPTKMRWRKGDDLKIWRYIWDILGIMSYLTTLYCSIYETFYSGLFLPKIHVKRFASIHPKVPFQCTLYQSHDSHAPSFDFLTIEIDETKLQTRTNGWKHKVPGFSSPFTFPHGWFFFGLFFWSHWVKILPSWKLFIKEKLVEQVGRKDLELPWFQVSRSFRVCWYRWMFILGQLFFHGEAEHRSMPELGNQTSSWEPSNLTANKGPVFHG